MFATFYQLQEQPFGVNPDPRYLYLSKTHREVFSSLLYRIQTDCGFLAMIAPPGMGKTTLLFHLLSQLQTTARTAFVFQTQCNSNDFMRYLLSEFGSSANTTDSVRMFQDLKTILVAEANAGRRCLVLIDEAQNLQAEVLETIRLLSDFETPRRKLLQIILSGQLELEDKLAHPGLAQLRQRLSSIARLQKFGTEETVLYIDHRLRVAGHKGDVTSLFDRPALARIVVLSGGIPRIINNVCFNALSLGFAIGARQIDSSIIEEVASDLGIGDSLKPASTLLSEIECMIPVIGHPPEEPSKYEDRPIQEVCAEVSTEPETAESQAAASVSAEVHSNPSTDDGVVARIVEAEVQSDTVAATLAQACLSAEPEGKGKEEVAKTATIPAPVAPLLIAANPPAPRVRNQLRRSRNRFRPRALGKLSIDRTRAAVALAILLAIGILAYIEHRGSVRRVEAKSTAQMAGRLHSPENISTTATRKLELARPQGAGTDLNAAPFGGTRQRTTAFTTASSNHQRHAAEIRVNDLQEKLVALSQSRVPDNVLQTQTEVPAAAPFTITDTPIALTSTVSHSLNLPILKDKPSALVISAPAIRMESSSTSSYVPPRAISRPPPIYPDFAKASRLQGDVMLLVSISSTGAVRNAKVLSGNTFLATAAENAALHWSYAPGLINGVAIESQMQIVVRFRLQ